MSYKDIIEIRKEPRGPLDYWYDSENRVLAVRWNDNYVIILATNCQAINPNGSEKWFSRVKRKIIEVPESFIVQYYNNHMGSVWQNGSEHCLLPYFSNIEKLVDAFFHVHAW